MRRALCASLLAGAGAAFAASPALAAQRQQQISCGGQTLTISTNTNHSSQNGGWGTAQVVAGGTGAGSPVAFNGTVVDTSQNNATLFSFSSTKGQGNAEHNQQTFTCTETITETAAQFFGSQLPPGVNPTDNIEFILTVTVVPKGQYSITPAG